MTAFTEVQRMSQEVIIGSLSALAVLSIVVWLLIRKRSDGRTKSILGLTYLLLLCPFVFFLFRQLVVRVDDSGIYYRYFAGKYVQKTIQWDQVNYLYVTKFKPFYGHTGKKDGTKPAKPDEYVFSGQTGLHVILKDGTEVILGTQQPEALNHKLEELEADSVINKEQLNSQ